MFVALLCRPLTEQREWDEIMMATVCRSIHLLSLHSLTWSAYLMCTEHGVGTRTHHGWHINSNFTSKTSSNQLNLEFRAAQRYEYCVYLLCGISFDEWEGGKGVASHKKCVSGDRERERERDLIIVIFFERLFTFFLLLSPSFHHLLLRLRTLHQSTKSQDPANIQL